MAEPGSYAERHDRAREVFGRFVPGVEPDRVFTSMERRFGALGSFGFDAVGDLWIAPGDSNRMVEGNDGGANVSFNGGRTWTEQDQPTAQFYRVTVDDAFPYNVYGAQQDNSTVSIRSRTEDFGIDRDAWHDVGGGESGWIAPKPGDPNIVFAGSYGGY